MSILRTILKNAVDTFILFECLLTKQDTHPKRRALLFRKDVLGDFVIFLPTLKHYREFYKDYEISLVVSDMCTGLTPLFAFIDDVIIFDQKKFRTNFWYRRLFIKNLTKKGFDIALYPVYSSEPIGDLIMKATKAPQVLDFKNIKVEEGINEMDRNMSFLSNVVGKNCVAQFPTIDSSLLNKEEFIEISKNNNLQSGKYIVMVVGSSAAYKMWPLEKMAEVADYCKELGYAVVLLGSKNEKILGEKLIQRMQHKDTIINLIGETKLPALIHVVAGAKFYFGSDTGILHIAAALNTPAIAVMGGGHFRRFFPYGDLNRNRIIFDENMTCKNDEWRCAKTVAPGEPSPCIRGITVESAKKEIDDLLAKID